ncbi:hypothetical protein B0H19DRAFT_1066839 [Mycena capillaripes]|nr:hypothetical protein B0H19DRAFT_1066839 [Mycena capillaripes]
MSLLPQELIDAILDELCGTAINTTLKSCSLVAHAFLVPSQRRLFRFLTLTSKTVPIVSSGFIERPHLASYVRDLHIDLHLTTKYYQIPLLITLRLLNKLADLGLEFVPRRLPIHFCFTAHVAIPSLLGIDRVVPTFVTSLLRLGMRKFGKRHLGHGRRTTPHCGQAVAFRSQQGHPHQRPTPSHSTHNQQTRQSQSHFEGGGDPNGSSDDELSDAPDSRKNMHVRAAAQFNKDVLCLLQTSSSGFFNYPIAGRV